MKIPETYEEFLKTPDEELKQIAWQKMPMEIAKKLMSFALQAINDFSEKDKLITEEKKKLTKSNWERYCE